MYLLHYKMLVYTLNYNIIKKQACDNTVSDDSLMFPIKFLMFTLGPLQHFPFLSSLARTELHYANGVNNTCSNAQTKNNDHNDHGPVK